LDLKPNWLEQRLKHPFSGLSHLAGAIISVVGLVVLLVAAQGKPWHTVSFAVYGATLIFLYVASALYHLLRLPQDHEERLLGLDRAAIYTLIAGTYTPICLIALPTAWGWSIFGIVWGLALAGIIIDIALRRKTPDWLQALLYLVTGWVVVVAVGPLFQSLPLAALLWLGAGSLIYTVGAVICVINKPHLSPRFNAHDLWHTLVIAGSVCHFIVMLQFIAPR
jgi:hemolysin III